MLGQTGARPPVGCVIARGGEVLAYGATDKLGGRGRHAEEIALARLAESGGSAEGAEGAEVFTTLEPCAHTREGGSCAERLVRAKVGRVVYLLGDPDPRTNGRGAEHLQRAGIEVVMAREGERWSEAYCLALGHICRIRDNRPMVTLKLAASLDGRIAPAPQITKQMTKQTGGEQRWITGELARERAHLLRAEHDAILVGSETVLEDDPVLSVRLRGWQGRQPLRVVMDTRLRLSPQYRLCQASEQPTWIFTRTGADEKAKAELETGKTGGNVRVIETEIKAESVGNVLEIGAVLHRLKEEGYSRVLVEGGARIASAFLAGGFVDTLAWFTAPVLLGAEATAAVAAAAIVPPFAPPSEDNGFAENGWQLLQRESWGDDMLSLFLATRHTRAIKEINEGVMR